MRYLSCAVACVLCLTGTACVAEPDIHLTGSWSGDWTSGAVAGTLAVVFGGMRSFGDMEVYDVSLTAAGPACPSGQDTGNGDRSAAFRGDDVHFAVRIQGNAGSEEENVYFFDGVLNGAREINGTYALQGGACPACVCGLGKSGTWRLFR